MVCCARLFCMIFILIPPPTILILEPILTKLFSMDCFTSTPPKWYYNRLRLKLMPFLDSFQACFKDKHRYFAGLYFLYRLLFPISCILIEGPQHYYGYVICLFMFITFLHVFLQPYKKRWHFGTSTGRAGRGQRNYSGRGVSLCAANKRQVKVVGY